MAWENQASNVGNTMQKEKVRFQAAPLKKDGLLKKMDNTSQQKITNLEYVMKITNQPRKFKTSLQENQVPV